MEAGTTDTGIFARIVCGVDGTPESLFAVKQANRLRPSGGSLGLVAAVSLAKAAHAGMAARHAAEFLQDEAEQAVAAAKELAPAESKIVNGDPATVLLGEAQYATLVALGSHQVAGGPPGCCSGRSRRGCSTRHPARC